jgi:hypothetical protein
MLFFQVRPANQVTITGVALSYKKVEGQLETSLFHKVKQNCHCTCPKAWVFNLWPARLYYADRCQKYKLCFFNKVSLIIEAVRSTTYVI